MPKGPGGNDGGGGRGHSSTHTQKKHKGGERGRATGDVLCGYVCVCVCLYLQLVVYV